MVVGKKVSAGTSRGHQQFAMARFVGGGLMAAICSLGTMGVHSAAQGAVNLSDNASATAYAGGAWANQSNGTINGAAGLGPWYQGPAGSGVNQAATWGFFTGSSANIYGTTAAGTIDTNGQSWGIYANNGSGSDTAGPFAYRGFTALSAANGNTSTLSLSMVTGAMSNPGQEGFELQSYNPTTGYATPIFQVAATGSGNYYSLSYGGYTAANPGFTNSMNTTIKSVNDGTSTGNDGSGITVAFTLESPGTFQVTVTPMNAAQGAAYSTGVLTGLNSLPINQLMVYNNNAGLASQYDYFNSLQITEPNPTPEPATLTMMAGAGGLLLGAGKRKREGGRG